MTQLSKQEKLELFRFNTETFDFQTNENLKTVYENRSKLHPEATAVELNNSSLTYGQLNKRANKVAAFLISSGVVKNDMVGICASRSFDLITGILGIIKSGAAYVPFDPSYPAERIGYMIKQSGIKNILIQEQFREIFQGNDSTINALDSEWGKFDVHEDENPDSEISLNLLAYVLFTSGSTGMPKGVSMPHRSLMNLIEWQKSQEGLSAPSRTLQFAPISFDVSFQELFTTWSTGGTLILIEDEMRLNAIKLLEFIKSNQIERLFLPFIALQHLAEVANNSKIWPQSLRDVITAGEQLQITGFIESFFTNLPDCRLHNHYGPTETHVVTAYTLKGSPGKWSPLPPIGKPVSHTHIYLLDSDMKPVKAGEQGELFVAGVSLAHGYVNREDLTNERFINNPFDDTGKSRLYRTGDIGKYDADGNIEYLGRADNQVKVRGYRIELGEVEVALNGCPGVTQAAVVLREDIPGDKRLVAYIVSGNQSLNIASVRKYLSDKLPDYMMPSAFVFVDALPKTPSGKIDRKALPKPGTLRPDINTLYVEPESSDEKAIARLWAKLLLLDKVGVNDNFFDLGGNSLLALQSIARLRQENGLEIPVVKLYQFPSVRALLNALKQSPESKSVLAVAKARFATQQQQTKNKSVEDGIAIVGMAGRFPGAVNIDEFWNNLIEGKETTTFFNSGEIDPSVNDDLKNDPAYVKARGVITDADKFDAGFFGINPRLAELMDPQQRIFLEVCWEALESAGYTAAGYNGLIGVYSGMGNNSYYTNNVIHHNDAIDRVGPFQVMVANEKDYIATRISHFMNLKGPGLSIHTACSTSLTAVAIACQGLWNNQCDMAIAGGIAITCPVNSGHLYQEGGMFSSDGHTRSFDEKASGTVFSDGSGVVILKKYRDAVKDGDTIYAVIRGVGINNDGSDKASFTAPSVEGQANAVAMAQADADVSPDSISYIETHGTATPLGDPIEVEALTLAFKGGTERKQFCAIGSVKTNFGHLTAAAGVAGLMKTALALKYKTLPASLHFSAPNPAIDFKNSPFFVNHKKREWTYDNGPLRAGVSSFGVGGTNVHVVVEEAPQPVAASGPSRSAHLFFVSTKDKSRTEVACKQLSDYFSSHPELNPADAAYTLQTGRVHFASRRFIVVSDNAEVSGQLHEKSPGRSASRELQSASSGVVFMFPGQGSQYVNMGANLYRDEIVFKESVDRCCEILKDYINIDLRTILYPTKGDEQQAADKLMQTSFTQPALFTIGYALAQLWMSWGVKPAALIGHSIGEFCAACISGIMSLEDALMLVASRGSMMQALPAGSMLSVRISAEEVNPFLKKNVSVAAVNGPSLCVISGEHEAVDEIRELLEKKEIVCKKLFTSHAFHSSMMDPIIDPFKELVRKVKLNAPVIPVVSTATATWLTADEAVDPGYWSEHLRKPVMFADGIKTLWGADPSYFLLEMGPRNSASTLARQQAADLKTQFAYPSLPDNSDNDAEWVSMLFAIGQLWLSGININWNDFYTFEKRKHVPLPSYPFEKKKYWVDPVSKTGTENALYPYNPFQDGGNGTDEQFNELNLIQEHMNTPSRKERIIADLKNVMEEASGIELATAGSDVTFLELGMDSLFLTQAALTISKKYGTKITFRQLNESYSTLGSLAAHLDAVLPADAVPAQAMNVNSKSSGIPAGAGIMVNNAAPGNVQWLIMQQMQIMQQQLAALGSIPASNIVSASPAVKSESGNSPGSQPVKAGETEVSESEKAELEKPFGAIARIEKTVSNELTPVQKSWLKNFTEAYNKRTAKSKKYTQEHRAHLADPRVVTGFKPTLKELIYQMVVDRSAGCKMWDIDGNEYIDVLNGFGSNFLGYGSRIIMDAVEKQLKAGIELGPQHPLAGEMTKLICEFTGYDRAGLCNTGSEAVLGAMRIARTVTGKNTIVCFNGSYHGINDEVIVRGAKNLKSFPAAAGIPFESVQNMLVLDYGTDEALEIIRNRANEIAAVMIEPIQSRRADFRPKAFIEEVRKIADKTGYLVIFDEVITGFRLLPGGAQEFYGVRADISTYGKVIGGGMPIGAIAGRREYMDALDGGHWQFGDDSVPEAGVTYFAGTFVRHPLALAAGVAVLKHLKERGMTIYSKLNGHTDRLVNEVNKFCSETGAPFHLVNFGSLFKVKWDAEQPYGELLFLVLRHNGLHIYDGFPCFFTDAFSDNDVDFVINKFIDATRLLQSEGFLSSDNSLNGKHHISNSTQTNETGHAPVPGAKLGKDQNGNPAWFVADPDRPGKYIQVIGN